MDTAAAITEKLDKMFPDKNLLTMSELAKYTGLSMPYVKKKFNLARGKYIDKAKVVSILMED